MALIKCPECGNEVSDKAVSCPQCGCPLVASITIPYEDTNENVKKGNKLKIILPVILLLLIL